MMCSRDELRGRQPGLPPQVRHIQNHQVIMPVDPASDGTWVAANDAGLALTVLNLNLGQPPTDRDLSRGGVIPELAGCATIDHAVERACEIQASRMMPFRLVLCDGRRYAVWRSVDPAQDIQTMTLTDRPIMFTSSGLGDHLVEGSRRELFESWFTGDPAEHEERQDAFHRHQWPDCTELSVCMAREDARTVSLTAVRATQDTIEMVYHPESPDTPAKDAHAALSWTAPKR